ncbi:MAG: hypothetical protein U0838_02970 [Chloroflexota bacterium]
MAGRVAPDAAAEVVALSNRFGADPMFVRAGGGNSSLKADGVLADQAVGRAPGNARRRRPRPLDRARLLALMAQDPATLPREAIRS